MAIKQHPDYCIEDKDLLAKKIWRYMKIDRLIDLLKSGTLYFSQSDKLGDKFEGSHTLKDHERQERANELRRANTPEKIREQLYSFDYPNFNKLIRKYVYINCWHINSIESDSMWKSYTEKGKGVAITSTIERLINSIQGEELNFLLGIVNYVDYDNDSVTGRNIFNPFFHKRQEFSSESEFRIATYFFMSIDLLDRKETDYGKKVKVDLNALLDEIIYSQY